MVKTRRISVQMTLLFCWCSLLAVSVVHGREVVRSDTAPELETRAAVPTVGETVPEGLSPGDWSSIRRVYEAGRHAVLAVEGGYRARNPRQQWETTFDGRGFLTEPDAGGWTWGLELESFGFVSNQGTVGDPESLRAEENRVVRTWDSVLEEWYVNDARGLEHGYTVHHCPSLDREHDRGPLMLTLAVRGGLRPMVTASGQSVQFLKGDGAVALTYSGLSVIDARGRTLDASFVCADGSLHLSIDERGALYPVTIDPVAQQAYLKASNTDAGDGFGRPLAVSGDTVVVGAMYEASNATGVDGDGSDNSASSSGAAYVFVRSGTIWGQPTYLKASNTEAGDSFAVSVAVSGDTVVVGAFGEDSSATGVNGVESDNSALYSGAAYVFVWNGTTWSQQAYLKASNAEAYDLFGRSVAISGDTVVVSAINESSSATGVNGDESDNSASYSGAAYVFVRSGVTWTQQAYLKASNTDPDDSFGGSVAVSGDLVVVGVQGEDSSATGVNGDQTDDSADNAGAAYVFERSGAVWSQIAYLKASNTDAGDLFGYDVALSGETIVAGAWKEDSKATGINGDQSDNSSHDAGAAYVFARTGSIWSQQAYLKGSNTEEEDELGTSVAVSGDTVVVGAAEENGGATGVNGDQSDNSTVFAGAAYVFARTGTEWVQRAYLKASNTGPGDKFGQVAVSGDTVVVGASNEASSATGVGGDEDDNSAYGAGAAYTFVMTEAPVLPFCFGDPGSGTPCPCNNDNDGSVPGSGCANGVFPSGAQLTNSGEPSVSHDSLALTTTHLEPHNSGLYFQADNDLSPGLVWGDGLRCAGGSLKRLEVRFADSFGTSSTTVGISSKAGNVTAGVTKYYQCWYRTTIAPPCGIGVNDFNASNGVAVTWGP